MARTAARNARKAKQVARRDVAAHAATPAQGRLSVTTSTSRLTLLVRKATARRRRFIAAAGATGTGVVATVGAAGALPFVTAGHVGYAAPWAGILWVFGSCLLSVTVFDKKIDRWYDWTPIGFQPSDRIAKAWVTLFAQRERLADQPAAAGWLDDVTYAASQLLTAARQWENVSVRNERFEVDLNKHHSAQGTHRTWSPEDVPAHLATRYAVLTQDTAAAREAVAAAVQLAHATVASGQGLWEHLSATNSLIGTDTDTGRSRFSVDTEELNHRLEVQRAVAAQYLGTATRGELNAPTPLSMPTGMGRHPFTEDNGSW